MDEEEEAALEQMKSFLAEKRNALCAIGTQDILPEPEQEESKT